MLIILESIIFKYLLNSATSQNMAKTFEKLMILDSIFVVGAEAYHGFYRGGMN